MDEWQVVPKRPTEDMAEQGGTHCGGGMLGCADEARKVYDAMLRAAPEPPHMSMTREEAQTLQSWRGMDGACAFHLIERHADGWGDVGRMMAAWLEANREPPNVGVEPVTPATEER